MFCRELNRSKCKTYLVVCERTKHALLIDPVKENTGRYIAVATYHGFRLDYLVDTHRTPIIGAAPSTLPN